MTVAYDRLYLEKAAVALGRMFDYACYDLSFSLADFWELFLVSGYAERFGAGEPGLLVGRSGMELARLVLEKVGIPDRVTEPRPTVGRSEEYWTGWALAHYQWETGRAFRDITSAVPVEEIRLLYSAYHEMDIRQFYDKMDELMGAGKGEPELKRLRRKAGFSQRQLSDISGVPVRTIQQYEQQQKDIRRARAETLEKLATALRCRSSELLL